MACKPFSVFHAIYHFAFLYHTLDFTHNLKKNLFGSKSVKETFGGHEGVGETQAIMSLSPDSIMMNNIKESEPWWNSNACKADKIEADKKMNELIVSWLEILS